MPDQTTELLTQSLEHVWAASIHLTTLASGILTLSIGFAKQVFVTRRIAGAWMLGSSWCCYLGSILCGMMVLQAVIGNQALAACSAASAASAALVHRDCERQTELQRVVQRDQQDKPDANEREAERRQETRSLSPYEENIAWTYKGQFFMFALSSFLLVAFGLSEAARLLREGREAREPQKPDAPGAHAPTRPMRSRLRGTAARMRSLRRVGRSG